MEKNTVTNKKDIANSFNSFFTTTGNKINDKTTKPTTDYSEYLTECNNEEIFL